MSSKHRVECTFYLSQKGGTYAQQGGLSRD